MKLEFESLSRKKQIMRTPWTVALRYWLLLFVFFLCADLAVATSNFLTIHLARGVTVELPKNWVAFSNNQLITLDSVVEARGKLADIPDYPSDLPFAANYYDEQRRTAAMFNIRYYPELMITQADSRAFTATDIKELDDGLRAVVVAPHSGVPLLSWMGTKKQSINGLIAFVTEYRRKSVVDGAAPFRVRLVRVLSAQRSFTVTISYREDQEIILRPICDYVIQSIRM